MTKNKLKISFVLTGICLLSMQLSAQTITVVAQKPGSGFRGLSVVDDSVAWVSGTKGTVGLSKNGGKTWDWKPVAGFEKSDFRDIEAFSAKEAIIMSAGTPAVILKTIDGGESWQVKYNNADPAYFFDAMDFSSTNEGWVMGDAINDKLMLLHSKDGGETWQIAESLPLAAKGEGAFAASGTCLRSINDHIMMVTGGFATYFIDGYAKSLKWEKHPLPFPKSKASQGAFSIAQGKNSLVIAGGDYNNDQRSDSTACYSIDKGKTWQLADKPVLGFQSCVEYLYKGIFLSTGTPGSNLSTDGGKTWTKIDQASFNVCRKAKRGKLVLLAGASGNIGIFKL